MKRLRTQRLGIQGYTIVELLVTISVATIGFVAIVDLQSSSLRGLTNARNTTLALNTAEHFIEMVRAENLECTPSLDNPECQFLPPDGASATFKTFGDLTDNMKSPVGLDTGKYDAGITSEFPTAQLRHFCVQYRSTWVIPEKVMRLDTRVLWPLRNTNMTQFKECKPDLVPSGDTGQVLSTGMVTISTTLWVDMF